MILEGESAEEFIRRADENYEKHKARKMKQKQALIDMMAADEDRALEDIDTLRKALDTLGTQQHRT